MRSAAAAAAFPAWAATPAAERGAVLKRAARAAGRARATPSRRSSRARAASCRPRRSARSAARSRRWPGTARRPGAIEGRVIAGTAAGSQRLVGARAARRRRGVHGLELPGRARHAQARRDPRRGCTAVLKAAEATPGTAAEVVARARRRRRPAGVVNLVFGDPAAVSEQLIGAPAVRAVTFTGSTAVGRIIAGQAAAGPQAHRARAGRARAGDRRRGRRRRAGGRPRRCRRSSARPASRASPPAATSCTRRGSRRSPTRFAEATARPASRSAR